MSQSAPTDYISALLTSGTPHWGPGGTVLDGSSVGRAVTVTYTFATSSRQVASTDAIGFATMNNEQRAAVRQALAAWSAVADITFVETAGGTGATMQFGTNRQNGLTAAYAYYPSAAPQGGDVFLANDSASNVNPTPGGYAYMTIIHEIGHALGLKHPGNYDAGSNGTAGPFLPAATDNYAYSIMSYNGNDALPPGTYLTGPSLYDISAIQYLYGANMSAGAGDTSYSLNTGRFTTLWDPNGRNTLNGGTQTAPLSLDLRAGGFSSAGGTAFLALAYGTTVQLAVGGRGDDTFIVNGLGNVLNGGDGTDTVVFSGSRPQYRVQQMDAGRYVVSGADGVNLLSNIEYLRFADTGTALSASVSGMFDPLRYIASNADLMAAFRTDAAAATQHLTSTGVYEGRGLTRFNPYNYLAGYGDLLGAFGSDVGAATRHYIEIGNREGRSSTLFDTLSYQASNRDLIAAYGDDREAAELHYIINGRFEGRSFTGFDAPAYLAANPDVNAAVGGSIAGAKQHYLSHGFGEGRALA